MALDPAPYTGPPLDEIQWRAPPDFDMGIHSNSVLFYFAQSPFYDRTSNNEVLFQQGLNNPNVTPYLATRELFEGRLKTMSGLEFVVAQEPAETGPGAGTGVWVINKQTRRKQAPQDEIIVHGTYFVVGEHIYMAASFADIISSRIAAISSSVDKILPIASSAQSWSPALGRVYQTPSSIATSSSSTATKQRDATPLPETTKTATATAPAPVPGTNLPTARLIEEALGLHHQFGDHYMDENPITGKPGDFQLASTGRKGGVMNLSTAAALNAKKATLVPALPALNTKLGGVGGENPLAAGKPTGKETKSPKTPGGGSMQKGKRRKGSRAAVTPQ
ncbi:MED6 mediator sub complex component-domain-containing protein [Parachaetomium inaequale]|uniref:Mediator of RNA polymerase II transcription subunit 6 n=1 Tax=Parachaetomium inaequale TaxID=2588326 RepID=A0AAN6PT21_9PEZI|nr:MED6 mediator sub complex component-domain-containing protein [Parachaetomium inaequale]